MSPYLKDGLSFSANIALHCKKRLLIFLSPAGMSLTKLFLAGSLVSDIPPGDGKTANLFYSVHLFRVNFNQGL